jgi:hypothetical protein
MESLSKIGSPTSQEITTLLNKIDFKIDLDYLDFIKNYNGGEGFLNKNNFVQFWNINQLIEFNPYYLDEPYCKNLFFFATDGSNLGYAFNKIENEILGFDLLEISENGKTIISKSFVEFLYIFSDSEKE